MNPQTDEQDVTDDALARHREALKKRFPLPPPARKPRQRVATLGVLIGALVLGLLWLDPAYRSERYSSASGQVRSIALADGSRLMLDGASQVDVSWHLRSRRVELLAGQALFDVAPATYRPFRTLAGSAEITVVGTRYSVSRVAEQVRVAVEEGRVGVRGLHDELLLTPGQQVLVRNGQLGSPERVDARALNGWIDGRVVFDRTPLVEVLDTLRRQRDTRVQLDDPDLAQLPVSGTFASANLDALLVLLPKILPVQLQRAADGSLSLSRRAAEK